MRASGSAVLSRAALALVIALCVAPAVLAAAGAPSGDGVVPVETAGNPDCVTVLGVGAKELKDDSPSDGNQTDGTLSVLVDIRNTPDGQVFDFSGATQTINAVIVKAGDNANVYTYLLGDTADTALHGPISASNGRFHDLSHISFCYDAPPPCVPPSITTDPPNVGVTYGVASVRFDAAASGSPTPTKQWYYSPTGAAGTFTLITGETGDSLTITAPEVADSGTYRAVYTNACGTANADAVLTVGRKAVTGTCTVDNKVYDGTRSATITGSQFVAGAGPLAGDDVTLNSANASTSFADPDVANGKPTPCNGFTLSGIDANNYTLTMNNTTANITPKQLTGTCTVADKVYDGTAAATVTGSSLGAGVVAGDQVSLAGGSSAFGDPDVGNGKATPCDGFTLSGPDAGNYTLVMSPTTANITPKPITGTCTVANKVYDGTTAATITGSSLQGVVAGDQVNLTGGNSAFGDADVGNGKATPCNGFALAGPDAGNYTLTISPTTANITPKPVVVTCSVADKGFDGNNSATITGAVLTGVVPGDSVSVGGGSATFNNANPGQDKPVTCKDFVLQGPDKDNYVLSVRHPTATIQRPPAPAPAPACLKRNIFAFVRTGNDAKRVVFFLDGEKYGTVTKRDRKGRFGVNLSRSELGNKKHVLSATVFFKTSRKPVKLIVFRFKPCLGTDVATEISVTNFGASCVRRSFLAFVKGDTISTVTFSLNGKRMRPISVADGKGRYKLLIRPAQLRPGKNVVRALIKYIASSKTKPLTLKKTVRGC